jgi:uncharacterized OsmC-like protein
MDAIRTTFERNSRALALRPGFGRGTAVTRVKLRDGLACDVEEGAWKFVTDMSEKSGGKNEGPNPGILGRAALGGCLAIGYAMWAAKSGVPISSLEVAVEADYDSRGMYGVDGVAPGYTGMRYVVHLESPASEAEVMRMLDDADAHSDFLHVFRNPQNVSREVRLAAPEHQDASSTAA